MAMPLGTVGATLSAALLFSLLQLLQPDSVSAIIIDNTTNTVSNSKHFFTITYPSRLPSTWIPAGVYPRGDGGGNADFLRGPVNLIFPLS